MGQTIIAALTSAGFVALITAVIQAVVGRKKMSADAAQIIEKAAGSAVERSEEEIKKLYARLVEAEKKIGQMDRDMSAMRVEMREKDRRVFDLEHQVEDLTEDLIAMVEYIEEMHEDLRRRDPHNRLLTPPTRIASHFEKDENGKRIRRHRTNPEEPPPKV